MTATSDDVSFVSQFALEFNTATASTQQWANDKNLLPTCCRAANEILCQWSACSHQECIVWDVLAHSVLVTCLTIANYHEQRSDLADAFQMFLLRVSRFTPDFSFVASKEANLHISMLFFTWEKPRREDQCGRPREAIVKPKKKENIKHDLCFSCSASATSTWARLLCIPRWLDVLPAKIPWDQMRARTIPEHLSHLTRNDVCTSKPKKAKRM